MAHYFAYIGRQIVVPATLSRVHIILGFDVSTIGIKIAR